MFLTRNAAVAFIAISSVSVANAQVSTACQPLTGDLKHKYFVVMKLTFLSDLPQ